MKKDLRTLYVFIFLFLSNASFADQSEPKIKFHEIRLGAGYATGDLKNENANTNYRSFPIFVQIGFNINGLVGIPPQHKGDLQLAVEPFLAHITDPDSNVEVGMALFFKYSYPLLKKISPYIEVGGGPMYLGVDTYEQEEAGFNFIDQGGAGIQYFFQENKSFNIGYRFRHISNAGVGANENAGINSQEIIAGISIFY